MAAVGDQTTGGLGTPATRGHREDLLQNDNRKAPEIDWKDKGPFSRASDIPDKDESSLDEPENTSGPSGQAVKAVHYTQDVVVRISDSVVFVVRPKFDRFLGKLCPDFRRILDRALANPDQVSSKIDLPYRLLANLSSSFERKTLPLKLIRDFRIWLSRDRLPTYAEGETTMDFNPSDPVFCAKMSLYSFALKYGIVRLQNHVEQHMWLECKTLAEKTSSWPQKDVIQVFKDFPEDNIIHRMVMYTFTMGWAWTHKSEIEEAYASADQNGRFWVAATVRAREFARTVTVWANGDDISRPELFVVEHDTFQVDQSRTW